MKRLLIALFVSVLLLAIGVATFAHHVYPRSGVVTEIDFDSDIVTYTDCAGFDWQFSPVEDFHLGDRVNAVMLDMFTPSIFDDVILNLRYEG